MRGHVRQALAFDFHDALMDVGIRPLVHAEGEVARPQKLRRRGFGMFAQEGCDLFIIGADMEAQRARIGAVRHQQRHRPVALRL